MASRQAYFLDFRIRLQKHLRRFFSFRHRALGRFIIGNPPNPSSFGLDGLDLKLREWIDTSPGYFIEIGANDGVAQSNTLSLELFDGWRGLLIEPIATTFASLQKNRNKRRNCLVRAACVSFEYSHEEVRMHYANLMSSADGLDSDIESPERHAIDGKRFLKDGDFIRTEVVPAMTLTSVLDFANAPKNIGLLSLDVEGAELEVLRGIDFGRYRIKFVLVESRGIARIDEFLSAHEYKLRAQLTGHDFLFELQEI